MMRTLLVLASICLSTNVLAETVMLEATQDNTLFDSADGTLPNGAGYFMFVGQTSENKARRAVLAFKNLGAIPADAQIQSVKLHLYLSRETSEDTVIRLSRLASDWGEGLSQATGQEGGGAPATADSATWLHRFYNNSKWNTPGGDFSPTPSAQMTVNATGFYSFESNEAMVADVQNWLADPGSNYGWIMVDGDSAHSAKRFNTREGNISRVPMLEVEYTTADSASDFSGPWFDPALDGEGMLVFQTPAGWLIYYFGYSSDMDRLWLVSNLLNIENLQFGQTYEFSLLVGEPGTFGMPTPSSQLTPWGTLQVSFSSCTNGVFTMNGVDGQKVLNAVKLIGIDGTSCDDGS